MKHLSLLLKKIDWYLDKHTMLWLLLAVVTILRVPNFFDPYWYGDEAIYLTVGQSIRAGKQLYSEIVDHKTPIIYYLATVPNQFSFRVLLFAWMVISTALFYSLAKKFFKRDSAVFASSLSFVLLTTLPWFEGHVPNGELFVLGFVLAGLWLLMKAGCLDLLHDYSGRVRRSINQKKLMPTWLFTSGVMYGLAVLTKVPALLDFGSAALVPWFFFANQFTSPKKKVMSGITQTIKVLVPFIFGVCFPIILSILYFLLVGVGREYLQFGLLYNLHYSQTWTQDFGGFLMNFFFSLTGKTLILGLTILALTITNRVPIKVKFFAGWYLLTLYAVLLSNRPYPHYFIQSIPPLALLLGSWVGVISKSHHIKKAVLNVSFFLFSGLLLMSISIFNKVGFKPYSTIKYYLNFSKFAQGKISQTQYYQTFNPIVSDNYQLASFLKSQQETKLFIWGNNAMLYALSQTIPIGKFTVAFHIEDLQVYDETLAEIVKEKPKYIVVTKHAPTYFPSFYQYLQEHYLPSHEYDYLTLFKRVSID